MKWTQIDAYHWERSCGRYTVDVVTIRGQQRFTAWRRTERKGGQPTHLGCFDTMKAAVGACSADVVKQKAA